MIAIFGHETAYGAVTGNFDLPEALATLAYEGRRRRLFEPEFLSTLVMVEQGVPRGVLKGSWAGAFGSPRSEERRVGKEWVSMCRSRWWPRHSQKQVKVSSDSS